MALKQKDNIGLLARRLHATLRGIYRTGKISKMDYRIDFSEAIRQITLTISSFAIAYNMSDTEERLAKVDETIGHFEAARAIIEMMFDEKVITGENGKISIMMQMATISENIWKWRNSLRQKARSLAAQARQEQTPV